MGFFDAMKLHHPTSGAKKHLYPEQKLSWGTWRARTVRALREIAATWRHARTVRQIGQADWIERRADALSLCGRHALARQCTVCGHLQPGSVTPTGGPRGGCHTRACPVCARERSARAHAIADRIVAQDWAQAAHWHHLTITTARDPHSERDHTVEALRGRLLDLRAAWPRLIADLRATYGLRGAIAAIECSSTGHVHAHLLIATDRPVPVPRAAAERDAPGWPVETEDDRARWADWLSRAGVGSIYYLTPVPQSELNAKLPEITKYSLKAPSLAGGFGAGERRAVSHPVIAARWEVASRSARLTERYGAARQVPEPTQDEIDEWIDDTDAAYETAHSACPYCGEPDPWQEIVTPTIAALAEVRAAEALRCRDPADRRSGLGRRARPSPAEIRIRRALAQWVGAARFRRWWDRAILREGVPVGLLAGVEY